MGVNQISGVLSPKMDDYLESVILLFNAGAPERFHVHTPFISGSRLSEELQSGPTPPATTPSEPLHPDLDTTLTRFGPDIDVFGSEPGRNRFGGVG